MVDFDQDALCAFDFSYLLRCFSVPTYCWPLRLTTWHHTLPSPPHSTHLNNRLSAADAPKSDTLLYVAGILGSIAALFGDYSAARTHGLGISRGNKALRRAQCWQLRLCDITIDIPVSDIYTIQALSSNGTKSGADATSPAF